MKSFGARWNNALAVVVLASVLSISFVPSVSLAAEPISASYGPSLNYSADSGIAGSVFAGAEAGSDTALLAEQAAQVMAAGGIANIPCIPCTMNPLGPLFCPTVACPALSGPGICVAPGVCMALSTIAIGGAAIGLGLGIVKSIFFDKEPGPRTGDSVNGTPLTGAMCPRYYQVTVPTSDQCAIYVPPVSGSSLNNSSQILNSFGTTNVSDALLAQSKNVSAPPPPPSQPGPLPSGAKGNISLTSTSATIQAGVRNVEANTESAGFFGANVPQNTPPQGFLERMCLVRPWQSPLISYGIPTSLFDNLCSSKSLRVGILPEITAAPAKPAAKPAPISVATSTAPVKPAGPYVVPRVAIRATPTSVSLGSRSTISWASQGVDSCTETSPDGSFNSNTLRGEASTVPISSATTFVISCVAPDGSHVTDSVTVNLAI